MDNNFWYSLIKDILLFSLVIFFNKRDKITDKEKQDMEEANKRISNIELFKEKATEKIIGLRQELDERSCELHKDKLNEIDKKLDGFVIITTNNKIEIDVIKKDIKEMFKEIKEMITEQRKEFKELIKESK